MIRGKETAKVCNSSVMVLLLLIITEGVHGLRTWIPVSRSSFSLSLRLGLLFSHSIPALDIPRQNNKNGNDLR